MESNGRLLAVDLERVPESLCYAGRLLGRLWPVPAAGS